MLSLSSARRCLVTLVSATMLCASTSSCCKSSPPPPVDDSRGAGVPGGTRTADQGGVSTKQKVVLLAGAAALYYLYKHHQAASAAKDGPDSQYYLSKNGRVYYRDADHRAHWVTPPADGISVPESEAAEYRGFQGYDRSTAGRDLVGLGSDSDSP